MAITGHAIIATIPWVFVAIDVAVLDS